MPSVSWGFGGGVALPYAGSWSAWPRAPVSLPDRARGGPAPPSQARGFRPLSRPRGPSLPHGLMRGSPGSGLPRCRRVSPWSGALRRGTDSPKLLCSESVTASRARRSQPGRAWGRVCRRAGPGGRCAERRCSVVLVGGSSCAGRTGAPFVSSAVGRGRALQARTAVHGARVFLCVWGTRPVTARRGGRVLGGAFRSRRRPRGRGERARSRWRARPPP